MEKMRKLYGKIKNGVKKITNGKKALAIAGALAISAPAYGLLNKNAKHIKLTPLQGNEQNATYVIDMQNPGSATEKAVKKLMDYRKSSGKNDVLANIAGKSHKVNFYGLDYATVTAPVKDINSESGVTVAFTKPKGGMIGFINNAPKVADVQDSGLAKVAKAEYNKKPINLIENDKEDNTTTTKPASNMFYVFGGLGFNQTLSSPTAIDNKVFENVGSNLPLGFFLGLGGSYNNWTGNLKLSIQEGISYDKKTAFTGVKSKTKVTSAEGLYNTNLSNTIGGEEVTYYGLGGTWSLTSPFALNLIGGKKFNFTWGGVDLLLGGNYSKFTEEMKDRPIQGRQGETPFVDSYGILSAVVNPKVRFGSSDGVNGHLGLYGSAGMLNGSRETEFQNTNTSLSSTPAIGGSQYVVGVKGDFNFNVSENIKLGLVANYKHTDTTKNVDYTVFGSEDGKVSDSEKRTLDQLTISPASKFNIGNVVLDFAVPFTYTTKATGAMEPMNGTLGIGAKAKVTYKFNSAKKK